MLAIGLTFISCMGKPSYYPEPKERMETDDSAIISKPPLRKFKEVLHPTPNYLDSIKNEIKGVILHHTAEPTVQRSLEVLCSDTRHVGTHVVIDTDGTRYIMANPERVTFHAGYSILNGRESCNYFTIGIEFQGNTIEKPLTEEQIASAIEYLLPILKKYNIPLSNIVTHEMVRQAYKEKYPNKRVSGKVDITPIEYKRFMRHLLHYMTMSKQ